MTFANIRPSFSQSNIKNASTHESLVLKKSCFEPDFLGQYSRAVTLQKRLLLEQLQYLSKDQTSYVDDPITKHLQTIKTLKSLLKTLNVKLIIKY